MDFHYHTSIALSSLECCHLVMGRLLSPKFLVHTKLLTARDLLKVDLEVTVWTGLERVPPIDIFACLTTQVLLFFLATDLSCLSGVTF